MGTKVVIVAYRPRVGKADALRELVLEHVPALRVQGLVTERPAICMRATDGTIVEIFEWQSAEAVVSAHSNPAVQSMWARFGELCDCIPIGSVPEAGQPFSAFTPLEYP